MRLLPWPSGSVKNLASTCLWTEVPTTLSLTHSIPVAHKSCHRSFLVEPACIQMIVTDPKNENYQQIVCKNVLNIS